MMGKDELVRRTARTPTCTKGSHNKGKTQIRPTVPMQLAASKSVRGWEEGEGVQAAILDADRCMCVCVCACMEGGGGRMKASAKRNGVRVRLRTCVLGWPRPACRPFRLAMTPATATCLCSL